jgi:uncharacterized protein (UPF0305 family)
MEKEDIRDAMLETMVISLEAQLRAIKRLRGTVEEEEPKEKSKSKIDMVYDILRRARQPLHVSQIIDEVEKEYQVRLERESIVSALSKKIMKEERFVRTDKNTFTISGR